MFEKGDPMMYLYRAAKRISDSLFNLKIVKVQENNLKSISFAILKTIANEFANEF